MFSAYFLANASEYIPTYTFPSVNVLKERKFCPAFHFGPQAGLSVTAALLFGTIPHAFFHLVGPVGRPCSWKLVCSLFVLCYLEQNLTSNWCFPIRKHLFPCMGSCTSVGASRFLVSCVVGFKDLT